MKKIVKNMYLLGGITLALSIITPVAEGGNIWSEVRGEDFWIGNFFNVIIGFILLGICTYRSLGAKKVGIFLSLIYLIRQLFSFMNLQGMQYIEPKMGSWLPIISSVCFLLGVSMDVYYRTIGKGKNTEKNEQ